MLGPLVEFKVGLACVAVHLGGILGLRGASVRFPGTQRHLIRHAYGAIDVEWRGHDLIGVFFRVQMDIVCGIVRKIYFAYIASPKMLLL